MAVSGAGLGAAMAVSNVAAYLFVIVISRSLGPADFGGLSALAAYGTVMSVPAGALQVVVARHVSGGRTLRRAMPDTIAVAGALAAITIALSGALAQLFGLPSALTATWLGLTLVPMTLTGAYQGILLGRRRMGALAILYLVNGGGRLLVGVIAAGTGAGVTAVFGWLLLASCATAAIGFAATGGLGPSASSSGVRLGRELASSSVSLGAFIALTSVDVIMARSILEAHASGGYALATTFARAIGWGTQFIALIIVPHMQGTRATSALVRASGAVTIIGAAATGVLALAPRMWMNIAGGQDYLDYAHLLVGCGALGTIWALTQVWLFAEMGRGRAVMGTATWLVVVAEVMVLRVVQPSDPRTVVAVAAIGGLLVLAVAVGLEIRTVRRRRSAATAT